VKDESGDYCINGMKLMASQIYSVAIKAIFSSISVEKAPVAVPRNPFLTA